MAQIVNGQRVYDPRGAVLQLQCCYQPGKMQEILLEGPRGTGKTRGALEWAHRLAGGYPGDGYPGSQILFVRKTLKSMRETVQKTFEDEVLGNGHPVVTGSTAKREHREIYEYPEVIDEQGVGHRSYIRLGGMDNPSKFLSSEWHFIFCFQAEELELEDWETLLSSLHRAKHAWVAPFEQLIADVNPARKGHWLNKRFAPDECRKHGRTRLFSKHVDNPSLTPEYLRNLAALTGARRDRWYLGLWVSEEGLIYPNWDPAKHLIPQEALPKIESSIGVLDWGINAPGCFQVWGSDADKRVYRLAEIYKTGWTLDKWAWAIGPLQRTWGFREITADPSRVRDSGPLLESMLADQAIYVSVTKAANDLETGLNLVRQLLDPDESGIPRMRFVRDALCYGQDEELADNRKPTCAEEEIEDYCWARVADEGNRVLDRPDRNCADHAMDTTRYAAMRLFKQGFDVISDPAERALAKSPYAELYETPESLAKKKRRAMLERPWFGVQHNARSRSFRTQWNRTLW